MITLRDRCQTAQHLSPLLTAVVAAPYFTGGRRPEEGEGFAPVLQAHGLKGCPEPVREAVTHCLPGSPAVGALGDAGASIMLLIPRTGPLLGRRDEQEFWLARMQHQEVGIATDFVLQVRPLLPGLATISSDIHSDARGDIHLVGIQGIDHSAVHIVVHPRNHPEGASIVRAFQKATLLDADKQGVRVLGVEVDVLRVGDVGRRREPPPGHIHRPQGREFRPVASEIVAIA